jgi:hypothetical protein
MHTHVKLIAASASRAHAGSRYMNMALARGHVGLQQRTQISLLLVLHDELVQTLAPCGSSPPTPYAATSHVSPAPNLIALIRRACWPEKGGEGLGRWRSREQEGGEWSTCATTVPLRRRKGHGRRWPPLPSDSGPGRSAAVDFGCRRGPGLGCHRARP